MWEGGKVVDRGGWEERSACSLKRGRDCSNNIIHCCLPPKREADVSTPIHMLSTWQKDKPKKNLWDETRVLLSSFPLFSFNNGWSRFLRARVPPASSCFMLDSPRSHTLVARCWEGGGIACPDVCTMFTDSVFVSLSETDCESQAVTP